MARRYPWDTDDTGVPLQREDDAQANDSGTDTHTDQAEADVTPDDRADTSADDPRLVAAEPEDHAWYGWDDHGRFRLHLDVGADTGAMLESAIEECHDGLFHERTDTDAVSVVDAVLEMAARSYDGIESPSRRSRFRANVHVEVSSGAVTDRRGRRVPPGPARRISCDSLVSVVCTDDGVPVSVGRSQHIVPDRARRLVEHRDGGCRIPGCHSDRFVEVHHIVHWSDGGPTDTWNLICLCPKHHRLHHQGRLDITGDADTPPGSPGAVDFTDRHGIPIRGSGAQPTPPTHDPPPIDGEWQHPLGERLDMRWLFFHDDPNRIGRSTR